MVVRCWCADAIRYMALMSGALCPLKALQVLAAWHASVLSSRTLESVSVLGPSYYLNCFHSRYTHPNKKKVSMPPAVVKAHAKFLDNSNADRDLDDQEKRATERFLRRWG